MNGARWAQFPEGTKNLSATPTPFCVALSPSVHCCTLCNLLFLGFCQWRCSSLTGFYLSTWASDFHSIGVLGVWPWALTLPHVLVWSMGVIIAIVKPQSKSGRKGFKQWSMLLSFQPSTPRLVQNMDGPVTGCLPMAPIWSRISLHFRASNSRMKSHAGVFCRLGACICLQAQKLQKDLSMIFLWICVV